MSTASYPLTADAAAAIPPRAPSRSNTRHFVALDAMRGVAALVVLVLHICRLFAFPSPPSHAHLAVDFFFLLSGFVIAEAYEARLSSGGWLAEFVRARIVRLYPMVLVGGSIGLVVLVSRQLMFHDLGWLGILVQAAPNFFLAPSAALQSFRPFGFLLNSPFWSLSCEAVVNLIYAAIAARLATGPLIVLVNLSGVALVVAAFAVGTVDVGYNWSDYGLGVVRAVFPFFLGVLIHRLLAGGPARPVAASDRCWRFTGPLAVLGLAGLLAVPLPIPQPYDLFLVVCVFPFLVVGAALAAASKRLDPIWKRLGDLSYPLYAVHYPIVIVFAQVSKSAHLTGMRQYGLAAVCALTALSVGYGALAVLDRPMRQWLDRRLPRPLAARCVLAK